MLKTMGKTTVIHKLLIVALCLGLMGNLAQPVAAQGGFREFLQSILPDSILDAFNLNDPPPPEVVEGLLSESEVLELEKPRSGFVAEGRADILTLNLPTNGTEFPNLLITLTVGNKGGDADIYCIPEFLFEESGIVPNRAFALWGSQHSQGADYIFISREDKQYPAAKVGLKADGVNADGVAFVCAIHGYSANGAEYTVELDIDFSDRSMVEEEQEAMLEIFEQCCIGSDDQCVKWKSVPGDNGDVSMDFCHMRGSICNAEGQIIRLDMRKFGMECEVPIASLVKLQALEKLQLNKNKLTGDVGELLEGLEKALPKLQHLDLGENGLSGDFTGGAEATSPLCKLTHGSGLAFLNLEENQVTGTLPACIFDATSEMRELYLEGNVLDSELPEISEDSKLEIIHLAKLGLTGGVPAALGALKSLVALDLSENALTGPLPETLGSSKTLKTLRLQGNKFEGPVPEPIGASKSLKFVHLERNALESLPETWYGENAASNNLVLVDASFNELEGDFPSALSRAANLSVLNLHKNSLSGPLPNEQKMFPQIVVLDLGVNAFEGALPEAFGEVGVFSEDVRVNSVYLPVFDLSGNRLTGQVPEFLYEANVAKRMRREIQIGGNNFDLPCPLPGQLRYLKDLTCNDGASKDEVVPPKQSTAQSTTEQPEEEAAVAPEQEPQDEVLDKETEQKEEFNVDVLPIAADVTQGDEDEDSRFQVFEGSIPEPELESDIDEQVFDVDAVGFETVTGDVVSPNIRNKGSASVDARDELKNSGFDVSLASSNSSEEKNEGSSGSKGTVMTGKATGGVAILGFLAILMVSIIVVVVVVRKKRAARARELDAVLAPDVEMATPPAVREADTVHMLEGVRSSST